MDAAPQCSQVSECSVPNDKDPQCVSTDCSDGICEFLALEERTPCLSDTGVICSDGVCVQCLIDLDCSDGQECIQATKTCGVGHCTNATQDGDETDVNCGGSCMPCDTGNGCLAPEDCESQICDMGICAAPVCGDGIPQSGEFCDDGNQDNHDDCPDGPGGTCSVGQCGDGFVQTKGSRIEECDGDGVGTPGVTAECDMNCMTTVCGDGVINSNNNETCDDGNDSNSDACPDGPGGSCQAAFCGDGFVLLGVEECDGDGNGNGGETALCDDDCTFPTCGDGNMNFSAGETCDDGNLEVRDDCPDGPAGTCRVASCNDGFWHVLGSGQETFLDCDGSCLACPRNLLLSELQVFDTAVQYIEYYNPTPQTVTLENTYLADYNTYYEITQGTVTLDPSDFLVKFPDGATMGGNGYGVVMLGDGTTFQTAHGFPPDFDLSPADTVSTAMSGTYTPMSRVGPLEEMVVMFVWDGSAPRVYDIDYLVFGNTALGMDKSSVVGYAMETSPVMQSLMPPTFTGRSYQRCDFSEGTERKNSGNGLSGHDETSENLFDTFRPGLPTPRATNDCLIP